MELLFALAGVVAGGALVVVFARLSRDLLRLREETRLLTHELARRHRNGSRMDEKVDELESVTIEVTTPAGHVVRLPLRPDDPESIGRFLKEAEHERGDRVYATG